MKKSKIMMLVGSALLLLLFVFPLWNITLEAPQYPQPIGMNIFITKIVDANPNDIQNINLMNHYVGMKPIPTEMTEFKIFPKVIIGMVILGLLIGFKAHYQWYLVWFILMLILGIAGMYDFYLWEYTYGHDLNAKAAIKFLNPDGSPLDYQPPLFGTELILNFKAHSYPRTGAYLLFLGMALTLIAFFIGHKESKK
ncbi:MAG: hypothetical protein COS42_05495 [Flavobacteriales bacterium CG03_land_8_20_14_0_80_35_15]|nr:MAG: hypothetical protein COS42_05495 [Flavobacteriales bacterium CG03_land_8_20_14_0_80_35_15]